MALAWVEEGSQVSPKPHREWGPVLPIPGAWLSSSGASTVLAPVEVVQGGRLSLKNSPLRSIPSHILSSSF